MKEESEKAGLKLNIQKAKIRAPGPISSWQIQGEKVEEVTNFLFLVSKVTADSDRCCHEIKRHLLVERKAMTNRNSIVKNRDITLSTKICRVRFSLVMYGCESWSVKKTEHQRIGGFKLCWRRLLKVAWIARRSNPSIPKEINPEYSSEGLMLKLKIQYFDHLV